MYTAISVEHLSKTYRLGAIGGGTLQDQVSRWWASLRGKPDPLVRVDHRERSRRSGDHFKALEDVSFDVAQGEVVGIIGRNGAGKSTLLKVLSQVTAPTSGQIRIVGRVASLLEVGTGFHPDLSGRENVFLNGAIMGMSKEEIHRKFDEIVAFSECGAFIDTPVKRYSSGMYVRLAFAVAAHLEPEILIIDEVLAVGDAAFQRKCIRKMGEAAHSGHTVLVVSHNMTVVSTLCTRAVLLEAGRVVANGPAQSIVATYLQPDTSSMAEVSWAANDPAANNGRVRLLKARITVEGQIVPDVEIDRPFALEVDFEVLENTLNANSSIHVYDKHSVCAFVSGTGTKRLARGMYRHTYTFPGQLLNDGQYSITIILLSETDRVEVRVNNAIYFTVHETKGREEFLGTVIGCVRPLLKISERSLSSPAVAVS